MAWLGIAVILGLLTLTLVTSARGHDPSLSIAPGSLTEIDLGALYWSHAAFLETRGATPDEEQAAVRRFASTVALMGTEEAG